MRDAGDDMGGHYGCLRRLQGNRRDVKERLGNGNSGLFLFQEGNYEII